MDDYLWLFSHIRIYCRPNSLVGGRARASRMPNFCDADSRGRGDVKINSHLKGRDFSLTTKNGRLNSFRASLGTLFF
jgi:hypothetical protein